METKEKFVKYLFEFIINQIKLWLQVIITLEDGSQIQQNTLELNNLDDQLVEIHKHPFHVIKAESAEEAADQEEGENHPTDTSASRESPKKKMKHQPFKPRVEKINIL